MQQRAETIQKILDNRKPIAEKTSQTIGQLQSLDTELAGLIDYLPKIRSKCDPEKLNPLENNLSGCRMQLRDCWGDLEQLRSRFDRNTFNIGIVGNARQGKSTFLQSLTGLTNAEIPTAAAGHCTGSPSIIVNNTEIYAEVEFYTTEEFLSDVIRPFYTTLGLGESPASVNDFRRPLPKKEFNVTQEGLFAELKKRQERINAYENLLNKQPIRIRQEEFREYIAQQDVTGAPLSKWIAVKMVTIHCPFLVSDVGRVAVCDTPGLGDFICGAEANLVYNIGRHIDAVVMLKRVTYGGIVTPEDTQLYDLLKSAIPEFPPNEWSHFLVNRSDEEPNVAAHFKNQIIEKGIRTRRLIELDCREQQSVLGEFDTILDDIADNQQRLDDRLYKARYLPTIMKSAVVRLFMFGGS